MRVLSRRALGHVADFDARVDRAFDRLRGNPASDRLFYGASELGDFSLVWLIIGAIRGLRSERDWHAAVRVGGGLAIESVLVNVLIKSLFRRTRPPWEPERAIRLRRPRTSSFPSGHATSAFSAAGLLSEDDVLWPLYYAIAVIVASSRVYVRVHHASDVVVGAAIGVALGRIGRKLVPLPPAPHIVAEPESPETGRGWTQQ
jgi:undecaprenyl-diphosphatase